MDVSRILQQVQTDLEISAPKLPIKSHNVPERISIRKQFKEPYKNTDLREELHEKKPLISETNSKYRLEFAKTQVGPLETSPITDESRYNILGNYCRRKSNTALD